MAKIDTNLLKQLLEEILEDLLKKGEKKTRKKSMTPKAIASRGKFSVDGKFAGPLNKNKYLFQAWEKSKVKAGCPLNRITKINREICLPDRPSTENVISPPGGFPLKLVDIEYNKESVHVKIEPIKINKNEKKIVCLLYICNYDPIDSYFKYFDLSDVKESVVNESEDKFEAAFNLNKRDKQLPGFYPKRIVYLCAVTLNTKGNVVRCSETACVDLKEPIKNLENQGDRQTETEYINDNAK